jgi:uncharacterized protein YvpB
MYKNESFFRNFPLLSAVGVLFALLLCMLTSAMIYITVPQTVPFFRLLINNEEPPHLKEGDFALFNPSPTPFQPLAQSTATIEAITTPTPTPKAEPITTTVPTQIETHEISEGEEIGDPPASAYISGIVGSPQLYTLDCEAQAAVDWARFFGVRISELDFIDRLPVSDDPEEGFVGFINGSMGQLPPEDYGIHAGPVANLLREFNIQAEAIRGWDLNQIKREIAAGRPVIVWIVNLPFDIDVQEYTAPNGNTTTVARFEHTWIVTGYNMNTLTVIDSEWTYNVKTQTFLERWNTLGNQAIVYRGE